WCSVFGAPGCRFLELIPLPCLVHRQQANWDAIPEWSHQLPGNARSTRPFHRWWSCRTCSSGVSSLRVPISDHSVPGSASVGDLCQQVSDTPSSSSSVSARLVVATCCATSSSSGSNSCPCGVHPWHWSSVG